ncbi:acyltransferase [Hyalangium versicolor]|uniref:acyltransferase n=1 Tax=Hyalangium versicolor TaxID=2861190 RepID=UPI001CCB71F6|nr:acyltransferase [Hyalangium versicolor]
MPSTGPFPLSPIDHLFVGHAFSAVLEYGEHLDAGRLEASLSTVLQGFTPLACHLVELPDARLGFAPSQVPSQWIEVRETPRAPGELSGPESLGEFVPRLATGLEQPLLGVRLTRMPSGSILSVTVSHAVTDGHGFFTFLRAWSRATLGRTADAPTWDRSVLAAGLQSRETAIKPEDVWRRTGFTWSPGTRAVESPQPATFGVRRVPPALEPSSGGPTLFENDLLCAWLLKTYAHVLAGPEGLALSVPIDYRRSYGGLPQSYFGNAVRAAPLWLDRELLERESIPELAARVQESVRAVLDERGARDSLECLEQLRREQGPRVFEDVHLADPRNGFLVTNVSRLPFGMLDFGRGPPLRTLLPAVESRTAAIQQTDEGSEVSLILPEAKA